MLTQKRPFAALAVRTAPQSKTEKLSYVMDCFGTRHVFEYPTVFIDQLDEEHLLSMKENPVALASVCVKRMLQAKKDEKKRFLYARELLRTMKTAGYSVDTCIKLTQFIEGITNLSAINLRKEFDKEMDGIFEETGPMQVRTPILRKVLRRKAKEWIRAEGKAEEKMEIVHRMVARGMDIKDISSLTDVPEEEIRPLIK